MQTAHCSGGTKNYVANDSVADDLGDDDGVGGVGRARYAQHHGGKCLIGLA